MRNNIEILFIQDHNETEHEMQLNKIHYYFTLVILYCKHTPNTT